MAARDGKTNRHARVINGTLCHPRCGPVAAPPSPRVVSGGRVVSRRIAAAAVVLESEERGGGGTRAHSRAVPPRPAAAAQWHVNGNGSLLHRTSPPRGLVSERGLRRRGSGVVVAAITADVYENEQCGDGEFQSVDGSSAEEQVREEEEGESERRDLFATLSLSSAILLVARRRWQGCRLTQDTRVQRALDDVAGQCAWWTLVATSCRRSQNTTWPATSVGPYAVAPRPGSGGGPGRRHLSDTYVAGVQQPHHRVPHRPAPRGRVRASPRLAPRCLRRGAAVHLRVRARHGRARQILLATS